MQQQKAFQALKLILCVKAVLLLLSACTNAISLSEKRDCEHLLPFPNLKADVIIVGKIVQLHADEHSIDVVVLDNLNGTLTDEKSSDCWHPYGNTMAITIGTSNLPDECAGFDTYWTEHIHFLSLSTSNASRCPSLMYDGVHRPVLQAHPSKNKVRIRRQNTPCKFHKNQVG